MRTAQSVSNGLSASNGRSANRGVALLLTVFLITLCSIIVIGLARSSYLSSRLNSLYVQRSKAEYLLKSTLNVARTIISLNKSSSDPPKDGWGAFTKGTEVPADVFGIEDPNTTIALEINPEGRNLPLGKLKDATASSTSPNKFFLLVRDSCARLFTNLKFDDDGEVDQTGLFPGKVFNSQELVANLIDYMDSDEDSYKSADFAQGIEDQIKAHHPFPNVQLKDIDELSSVPGFTPKRVKQIINYVSIYSDQININSALPEVLKALDADLTDAQAIKLKEYIEQNGGFDSTTGPTELPNFFPNYSTLNEAQALTYRSPRLKVRAKVQFGERRFFLDSVVYYSVGNNTDLLPRIESLELYG